MTHTLVIACCVPVGELDELELTPRRPHALDRGAAGYTHKLELPEEADMERLEVELYKHFLEVRAPLRLT